MEFDLEYGDSLKDDLGCLAGCSCLVVCGTFFFLFCTGLGMLLYLILT